MKKSLLFFMSFCFSLLLAEAYIQTNYNTYNQFSFFENQFNWIEKFDNDFVLNFSTRHQVSENSHFKRSSKTTNYNYNLIYDKYLIKPFITFDYTSLFNSGLPEDSVSVSDKYVKRAGIGYSASFLDNKLFIQQTGNYSRLDNPLNYYYGIITESLLSYRVNNHLSSLNSSLYHRNNDTFLERFNSSGLDLNYRYNNTPNDFFIRFRYDIYQQDIYLFNTKDDRSYREDYLAHLNLRYNITDDFDFYINNRANFRRLKFDENVNRENWVLENDFNYHINYQTLFGQYYTKINLNNRTRYLRHNDQSRDSEEKQIVFGALWSFAIIDTLRIETSNSILQNSHSGTHNFLDNDRLMTLYSIQIINNFNNHSINNIFLYSIGEQVFLNSSLSANNHEKVIYQWSPETEFYLNQFFRLHNKYTIRADYEYFIWKDYFLDRFYRYHSGEIGIRFINKYNPIIKNNRIYFKDEMDIYTAISYENNESAEFEDGVWYRNNTDFIRNIYIDINYKKNNLFINLKPTLKYFNNSLETEIRTETSIMLNDLEINMSINPIGKQFNKMIWRLNAGIVYRF